jgi:hypothetical protein
MILRYELLSNFISYFLPKDFSNGSERFKMKIEKEMKRNREKVKKLILKDENANSNFSKEKSMLKKLIQNCEEDFRKLEEKKLKLLEHLISYNTSSDRQTKIFDLSEKMPITETEKDIKIESLFNELNQLQNKNYNEFLNLADENRVFKT